MRAKGVCVLLAIVTLATIGVVDASPTSDTGESYYRGAITTLADELEKKYVFADVGREYAAMLRKNLAAGVYRGITDASEISKHLTDDLSAVRQDLHLRVRPIASPATTAGTSSTPPRPPVEGAAWLADGVAYIRFNLFASTQETVAATRKFMQDHANAKAIIIDARHNHGGGGDEINVMLPYLFAKRTRVVDMELDREVAKEQGYSQDRFFREVEAPPGRVRFEQIVEPDPVEHSLFKARVYYLTSLDTGSAAEALAFIFKTTHRATLVGERTRGMDHFGQFVPIGQDLECFLPMGRTFDPLTNTDWEGGGVIPDVVVPPDDALRVATKLAENAR